MSEETSAVDDEFSPTPPEAQRVAARALVLAAVVCRSALEGGAGDPEAEAMHKRLKEWTALSDVQQEFETSERDLVAARLGTLSRRQRIDASWRSEGLVVLAWALQRASLPSYSKAASGADVADTLGFYCDRQETALVNPALREPAELELLADQIMDIHWRFRDFAFGNSHRDFASFEREYMRGKPDLVGFAFANGDLAIDGAAIADVSSDRRSDCESIVRERHQAANWLLGTETLYSDVTTDT